MKLMKLLTGLDDSFMQLRSNILVRVLLLDAKRANVLISSEESHRVVIIGSGAGTSQRSQSCVFNSSVSNIGNSQRPQTFGNPSRPNNVPRPNNNRNKRVTVPLLLSLMNRLFISLIKENSINDVGKGVHTNMAGYCVSLVSVHKVARDSKFIVAFDELKCLVLSMFGIISGFDGCESSGDC
ncbi:hypothetical protein Tco_0896252 [Tanacetum coccineum]